MMVRRGYTITRSIPARAGEPARYSVGCNVRRVYPRACGGTRGVPLFGRLKHGLSPRVRGNLLLVFNGQTKARSIPARAGEPLR